VSEAQEGEAALMNAHFQGALRLSMLVLALLAVGAPSAQAAEVTSHPFLSETSQFVLKPGNPPSTENFEGPCGIAFDSAGDLYASNYYHDQVDVLNASGPSGLYITRLLNEEPSDGPCAIAVDNTGDLYVNNYQRNVVEYRPLEFPLQHLEPYRAPYGTGTVIDSAHSTGLALDPAGGDLYVDDGTYVAEYEPSGALVARIGPGSLGEGYGVAVSDFAATKGDVYVPDASTGTVKVYNPAHSLGEPVEEIDGAGTPQQGFASLVDASVAIDPSDGHLYVVDNLQSLDYEHPEAAVDEFNAAASYRGQIGRWITHPEPGVNVEHHLVDSEPTGLAIDGSGDVYVTNGNSEGAGFDVFGPTGPAHGLKVTRSGTGGGIVTSAPAGIDCGTACLAEFNAGAEVSLTATPDAHSVFAGWSGACAGTGTCRVTMIEAKSVGAEFQALPQKTLSVVKEGSGAGAITSSPAGIACTTSCQAEFNEGSALTLEAQPAPLGSRFTGWTVEGDPFACSGAGLCEVALSQDITVKADFEAVPIHTLSVEASGEGTLSSSPAGIRCPGNCSAQFDQGTEVTLAASPGAHQAFSGWSGACSGTGACKVDLAADTSVSAGFTPILHTLSLSRGGSGTGTITSSPAGIVCGSSCSARYKEGTELTLTAVPAAGSTFSGWTGGACSGTGTCLVLLGADTSVGASFAQIPVPAVEPVAPPPGRFTLGSVRFTDAAATVALTVPSAGTVTATGTGLQEAKVHVKGPGSSSIHLALSKAGAEALEEAGGHTLKLAVTLTFTPKGGGAPLKVTRTIAFRKRGRRAKDRGEAQIVEKGDLFTRFDGGIFPTALPRSTLAPISVRVDGTIKVLSGAEPPALRQITIELNRAGHLDTQGLPICRLAQVRSSSNEQALAACGEALVGGGDYLAATTFPEQEGFPNRGHILAFNSTDHGHPAILAHIYGTNLTPSSRVLVFDIRHKAGTYGTVLSGELPPALNRYGYLKRIDLSLHRRFVYRGRPRSYLSAACAAPKGFPGATFPFARSEMAFADGRTLSATLTRSCRVAQ
jgi:Divergent InlB B-repeat domain